MLSHGLSTTTLKVPPQLDICELEVDWVTPEFSIGKGSKFEGCSRTSLMLALGVNLEPE